MSSIEYLHPSALTRIVDKSYVPITAMGQTSLFAPHFSKLGQDNVIVEYNSDEEFLHYTGALEMAKYGQASYNIVNWLRNEGKVYGLRLLPDNATFANLVLSVKIEGGSNVHPVAESIQASHSSEAALRTYIETPATLTEGEGGTIPLGVIYPIGRGEGYNGLGVRITLRDSQDNDNAFRTYNMSFTRKSSTGADEVFDGPYIVSFNKSAYSKASQESLYWEFVLNKYSSMRVIANSGAYAKLATYIFKRSANHAEAGVSPENVDILFGIERNTFTAAPKVHDGVVWEQSAVNGLGAVRYLANGTDGTFEGTNSKASLLVKAFNGLIDPNVTDKWMYEIDMILDANFETPVKNAINSFVTELRGDCVSMVDTGFQATPAQAIAYRKESIGFNSYNTAIFAQDFNVFDAHTGESIRVTTPYFLASKIPANDYANGIQWPFVGPRRGTISGYESISYVPNAQWRENMYVAQVNYVERDNRQTNLGTQRTSQIQNSALSDINNVRVLMRIRRDVERIGLDYRFEFNDAETHESLSYALNQYLQKWVANRACTYVKATVYASDYDKQQRIVRVKIELQFNGVIERVFTDITVNR